MANTQNYYYTVQDHYFRIDSDITGGLTSPVFNRNFRVLDSTCFVTTAVAGGVLTVSRIRGGVPNTVVTFDLAGTGRAPIVFDIDQLANLFESGDQMVLQTSAGAGAAQFNLIVYLQQFSV